jgi:hypothetical protein
MVGRMSNATDQQVSQEMICSTGPSWAIVLARSAESLPPLGQPLTAFGRNTRAN